MSSTVMQFENPLRMVRELRGAPMAIIWVLVVVRQRVSQDFLVNQTGYTDKPIRSALHYLEEVGLINHNQAGWQLVIENARQLPLMMINDGKETVESDPVGEDETSRNNSDISPKLSKEVEIHMINSSHNSSTNLLKEQEVGKSPSALDLREIQQVLDAAESLFGNRIMGDPRDYANIDRLLCWIAEAYCGSHMRGRLKIKNPAGLVYWAFHTGRDTQCEKQYQDAEGLDRYLPESFLRACGQWDFVDDE